MNQSNSFKVVYAVALSLIGLTLLSVTMAAQSVKVAGLIKGRNGDTMIVQTSASPDLVILLTDSTQVGQVEGLL